MGATVPGLDLPDDPLAVELASEPALLTVRESRLAFLLSAAAPLFMLGLFLAAWFAVLLVEPVAGGNGFIRILGRPVEMDPTAARVLMTALGVALGGGALWGVARTFGAVARGRVAVTTRALVATTRTHVVVLPFEAMGRAVAEPFLGAVRLRLRAPGAPTLTLSRPDAARVAAALRGAGVACEVWDGLDLSLLHPLATGEAVRWSGRPGWRSFDRLRLFLLVPAALPVVAYLAWMAAIWTGPGLLVMRLVWSMVATTLVGGTAFGVLALGAGTAGDWLRDLVGVVVVTDRRLLWRMPLGGRVYREVEGAAILSADVVEGDGARGWVALRVAGSGARRGADAAARDLDLWGLPDPDGAVAALRATMARNG